LDLLDIKNKLCKNTHRMKKIMFVVMWVATIVLLPALFSC